MRKSDRAKWGKGSGWQSSRSWQPEEGVPPPTPPRVVEEQTSGRPREQGCGEDRGQGWMRQG